MFDYKKEYKEFYLPPAKPQIITVPAMNFIAVDGKGNPNDEGGAYQKALGLLYGLAFTLKMSPKSGYKMEGFFEYVVPPLEGFWFQDGVDGIDYSDKSSFCWTSVIRLPDFIKKEDFDWAVATAEKKKKTSFEGAYFWHYNEALCVQCMHIGPFDNEPATVALMDEYIASMGYENDMTERHHHEIYLSDFRRSNPEKIKTVIRHPIKKI